METAVCKDNLHNIFMKMKKKSLFVNNEQFNHDLFVLHWSGQFLWSASLNTVVQYELIVFCFDRPEEASSCCVESRPVRTPEGH